MYKFPNVTDSFHVLLFLNHHLINNKYRASKVKMIGSISKTARVAGSSDCYLQRYCYSLFCQISLIETRLGSRAFIFRYFQISLFEVRIGPLSRNQGIAFAWWRYGGSVFNCSQNDICYQHYIKNTRYAIDVFTYDQKLFNLTVWSVKMIGNWMSEQYCLTQGQRTNIFVCACVCDREDNHTLWPF